MNERKIIFDCDIGCDDAVALIALLTNKDADLIAITCVRGNLGVDDAVANALKVVELCGRDVPVYRGCDSAMVKDLHKGRDHNTLMQTVHKEINGEEILIHEKSFKLDEPLRKAQDRHAVSYLVETLLASRDKIDICAVGPLTNIGMAIRMDSRIVEKIGTIYIMGDRTPLTEANFYDDPEAAEIVLTSGARCLVCPIEPCEEGATYDFRDLNDIKALNTPIADFLYEELHGYIDRCNILFGFNDEACCAYDYAAVAPLLDESVITEKRKDIVRVDISGGMAGGQMVIDRRGMFENEGNVEVIYHMDAVRIHEMLLEQLRSHKS